MNSSRYPSYFARLAFVCVLFLIFAGMACAEDIPARVDVDKILKMPYDSVVVGTDPLLSEIPERLPELDAGSGLIFFLDAKGDAHFQAFSPELNIQLTQPEQEYFFRIATALSTMDMRNAVKTVYSYTTDTGRMDISTIEQDVISQSLTGLLKDESTSISVKLDGKGSASMEIASLEHSSPIMQGAGGEQSVEAESISIQSAGTANMATMQGISRGTGQTHTDGSQASVSNEAFLKSSQSSNHDLKTIQLDSAADLRVKKGRSNQITAALGDSLKRLLGAGEHGSFVDEDQLNAIFEDYFLGKIDEMLLLSGLLDEFFNTVIVDEASIPTIEEQEAFLTTLKKNSDIMKLLLRDFSKQTRYQADINSEPVEPITIEAEVKSVLSENLHYHGHPLGLLTSLHNVGPAAIYDTVVLLKVPAHTLFDRFPVEETRQAGYLHFYLPEKELLIIKIYSPIKPKERFTDLAVFTFDPWFIDSDLEVSQRIQ